MYVAIHFYLTTVDDCSNKSNQSIVISCSVFIDMSKYVLENTT